MLEQLLTVVETYLRAEYLPERKRNRALHFWAEGVAQVSTAFTAERGELPHNYFNQPAYRAGYLLYFLTANFPKLVACLQHVRAVAHFADRKTVRVLDLGCGPGTAGLAAAAVWHMASTPSSEQAPAIEIIAVDHNKSILQDAATIFAQMRFPRARLRPVRADLHPARLKAALRGERYDMILCANLLNEFDTPEARHSLVEQLLRFHLADGGRLLLVEPALQLTSRALMALHDAILPVAQILAPCLHQAACPMLAHNQRDWCHTYIDWKRPELIAKIDNMVGIKKDFLKFSYLWLASKIPTHTKPAVAGAFGNPQPAVPTPDCGRYRVVSAPLHSNGKTELLLCPEAIGTPPALRRVHRLERDAGPQNAAFTRAWRGDIAEYHGGDRLEKSGTFMISESFQPNKPRHEKRPARAREGDAAPTPRRPQKTRGGAARKRPSGTARRG